MSALLEFRKQKDNYFANSPDSPIPVEQRENFDGLKYFPEAPELRFELEIEPFAEIEMTAIQTTTGEIRQYERYGKVHFEVDGKQTSLTVFATMHGFFIPFVDSLAGKDTYGAGRYLDPEITPKGKLLLDFNMAYNPYCVYNELYSCPLTPAENRLSVPIKAGEKDYK